MPAKNALKTNLEGGFYHVYNRGVEKRRIFLDDKDYTVFLNLLKYYLSPTEASDTHPLSELEVFTPKRPRPLTNLHGQLEVHSYCLMPNHFHLLIRQNQAGSMQALMRKLMTNYVMYFNRRYERIGHLFQGVYKAVLVESDDQLLHLSRYIHQNPSLTKLHLNQYPYSSYKDFIGEKQTPWLTAEFITSFFDKKAGNPLGIKNFTDYKSFVEDSIDDPKEAVGRLALESD